jgi:hypothetical protein
MYEKGTKEVQERKFRSNLKSQNQQALDGQMLHNTNESEKETFPKINKSLEDID